MKNENRRPAAAIGFVFLLCSAAAYVEFLFIKTDRTILGENVLCKLICILAVGVVLRRRGLGWRDLGFRVQGLAKGAIYGFSLGAVTFAIAYLCEFMLLRGMGKQPRLAFFISNFALSGQNVTGTAVSALLICIAGNILNVWAEEGLFRGLFLHLGAEVWPQKRANLTQSLLFGLWHVVLVAVWVADGEIGLSAAAVAALGYVVLAGILAYEWGLCAALTGTLWVGVFEHLFNNFIGNALHMVTETGTDELQIFRVVLSNVLSLAFVLTAAAIQKRNAKKTAEISPGPVKKFTE